jgi:hypothetical protein
MASAILKMKRVYYFFCIFIIHFVWGCVLRGYVARGRGGGGTEYSLLLMLFVQEDMKAISFLRCEEEELTGIM